MTKADPLAVDQVNRRMKAIRKIIPDTRIRTGWIRYLRQSLNMTLKQLANRTNLSTPTVAQAERGEAAGKITISTLKTMAHAMECEFIYAFVPRTDIDIIMKNAAQEKAKKLLANADTHMTLEDQRVKQSIEERINRLADQLFQKGDVW